MKSSFAKHRMKKRRKHKPMQGDVELNMAAMLDMAFQLLAFFVLTFRPSPVEAEVLMNMPKTAAVTSAPGKQQDITEMLTEEEFSLPLKLRIHANDDGSISSVTIGTKSFDGAGDGLYNAIDAELKTMLTDFGYSQVDIQADKKLIYEPLMKVIEKCAKQRLQSGEQLSKLTISTVE
jgi:biopolymer transport protein ExbD